MPRTEFEARNSKGLSLFSAVAMTIILIIFVKQEGKELLNLKVFNPNIINAALGLLLLIICIVWWQRYFDQRPILKITNDGIQFRNNAYFYSRYILISWAEVNYFYMLEETKNIITHSLCQTK